MPQPFIYLDHAATTPLREEVAEAMRATGYGNPSSIHQQGKAAKKALQSARQTIATCLNTQPDCLTFTGSGSEANNLAILGLTHRTPGHLIISAIEHDAVAKPAAYLASQGWDITVLPVSSDGVIALKDLEKALRPDTALVSIMHGNNEMGSLQPITDIGNICRAQKVLFHCDAVQTAGKLSLDLAQLPIDYLSASAHKIYGPKGLGLFYSHPDAPRPVPLVFGGGQEGGLRSGTENVAGIAGFAKAFELAVAEMPTETPRLRALQERLISGILANIPQAELNGPRDVQARVPGNVHVSFPPGEGEALVLQLDLHGIGASTGSACKTAAIEPSKIILALGKSEAIARATVRFSLGRSTTEADIDQTIAVLTKITAK